MIQLTFGKDLDENEKKVEDSKCDDVGKACKDE